MAKPSPMNEIRNPVVAKLGSVGAFHDGRVTHSLWSCDVEVRNLDPPIPLTTNGVDDIGNHHTVPNPKVRVYDKYERLHAPRHGSGSRVGQTSCNSNR